jgi:hypothetical protein
MGVDGVPLRKGGGVERKEGRKRKGGFWVGGT